MGTCWNGNWDPAILETWPFHLSQATQRGRCNCACLWWVAKFRHLEFSTRPALAAGKDGKDGKDGKAKRSEWKQAIHYLAGETAAMDSYGRFFSIKMDQHGMNVFFLYWQWGMNAFFFNAFFLYWQSDDDTNWHQLSNGMDANWLKFLGYGRLGWKWLKYVEIT